MEIIIYKLFSYYFLHILGLECTKILILYCLHAGLEKLLKQIEIYSLQAKIL